MDKYAHHAYKSIYTCMDASVNQVDLGQGAEGQGRCWDWRCCGKLQQGEGTGSRRACHLDLDQEPKGQVQHKGRGCGGSIPPCPNAIIGWPSGQGSQMGRLAPKQVCRGHAMTLLTSGQHMGVGRGRPATWQRVAHALRKGRCRAIHAEPFDTQYSFWTPQTDMHTQT